MSRAKKTAHTEHVFEFKNQRGILQDNELTAQSYYEAFEESVHDGNQEAETLADVFRFADKTKQRANRPEPKQLGLHPLLR